MKLMSAAMLRLGASKTHPQAHGRPARRVGWIAGLTGAALALTAGVIPAVAVATSARIVYHACVTNRTGAIKIVSASARCRSTQHKISWNRSGPAGPPGGVTGYSSFNQDSVFLGSSGTPPFVTGTLALPKGKFIVTVTANAWANLTSGPDTVFCTLFDGTDTSVDSATAALLDDGSGAGEGSFALTIATTEGGKMKFKCADATRQALVQDVSMTAIPLRTLHGTTPGLAAARHSRNANPGQR